ncbi:MAG TPA: FHA domain-containing protein [Luteimonas sp.]|nr:FHA domain-containing protein [Luteimonas sp.]
MKLVFPGGEHPQVLLGHGVNRVGSGPDATILLDRPGVMPRHCELHVTQGGVMLQVPAGATVRVNDRAVDGLIALRPGDLVAFEQVEARLASLDAPAPRPMAAAPGSALGTAPANDDDLGATTIRPVLPRYVLRGISAAGFGRTFPLVGPTTLGRAADCGIRLDHPGLSRHHARLTPTSEGLLVEDLGSTNGWLLNDVRTERAWAVHGDEVGFDLMRFRVVAPGNGETVEVVPRQVRRAQEAARGSASWRWAGGLALAAAMLAGVAYLV